ncbi:MAG TPA: hypothetical protein VG253_05105 [Streptosporangiaceae bacterium]|nr:hypothetical protein [Streptosporangiaceae bacterium]
MTDSRDEMDGGARSPSRSRAANVLADRMAAALLHHEPGWRLPRYTALARRYNVSPAEVESAIEELSARHLLTRLPDGQVFRASPAEYRLVLEGLPGFGTHVDPMGGELRCKGRTISMRRAPEDIMRAVGAPGDMALTIRSLWTVGGEPAAHSVTYLPPSMEGLVSEFASPTSPAGPPGLRAPMRVPSPGPGCAAVGGQEPAAHGRRGRSDDHDPVRELPGPDGNRAGGRRPAARPVPDRG